MEKIIWQRMATEKQAKDFTNPIIINRDNTLFNFDENILQKVSFESEQLNKIFQLGTGEKEIDKVEEHEKINQSKDKLGDLFQLENNLLCNTTNVKLGDLFQLGDHRLLCGDATKKEDVEILMAGEKADMVFTDPPYNIKFGNSKNPRHKIRNLINDNLKPAEWEKFNISWLKNVIENYKGGDIYVWGSPSPEGMRQRLLMVEIGFHWSATICWIKDKLVLSPSKYQRQYEPCFYGWLKKSTYCGDRKQTEVWNIKRPTISKEHPTMKPIELCSRAIMNSSKKEDIVLDLFGGSGSTLIACEQLKRKCRMMEIEPIYCEVIIKRWEKFTGKKAIKLN